MNKSGLEWTFDFSQLLDLCAFDLGRVDCNSKMPKGSWGGVGK